jgi:ATP/ADP translocase
VATPTSRINYDKLGAIASAVCAVHCLLTGVALGLLSVAGLGFVGSLWTDVVFLVLVLSVGGTAIAHGIRKHHSAVPAMIFVAGLLMFLIGHFAFGHSHAVASVEPWGPTRVAQVTLSVAGGLCIVLFHFVNFRLQKNCACDHCRKGA